MWLDLVIEGHPKFAALDALFGQLAEGIWNRMRVSQIY